MMVVKNKEAVLSIVGVVVINRAILIICVSIILGSCGLHEHEPVEVTRLQSPDLKVDAVLTKGSVNATTSTVYKLFLVPHGAALSENPVAVIDKVKNIDLKWEKNQFLELSYDKGRVFQFTNFWHSAFVDDFSYVVEIRLSPPMNEHSLSL